MEEPFYFGLFTWKARPLLRIRYGYFSSDGRAGPGELFRGETNDRVANGALGKYDRRSMSAAEIIAELPKLSLEERRRLAEAIFDLEAEADLLRECDRNYDRCARQPSQ